MHIGAPSAAVNATSTRSDRSLSPGGLSEDARRELISRQRNALYGEGPFGDTGGYIDETGTPRQGLPAHHGGPPSMRGPSPLAYEYGRNPPTHPDSGPQSSVDPASVGLQQRERTSSNASPQSNPPAPKGPLEQANRTSNSSPGSGSPQNGKPANKTVAPIGTRPSAPSSTQGPMNPALARQSTTPLPSPLNHGYNAPTSGDATGTTTSTGAPNPTSTASAAESSTGLSGWGQRAGWGPKAQTSVWG